MVKNGAGNSRPNSRLISLNIGEVVVPSISLKSPYVYYFLVSIYAKPPLLGALSHTMIYLGVGERPLGEDEDCCIWH